MKTRKFINTANILLVLFLGVWIIM